MSNPNNHQPGASDATYVPGPGDPHPLSPVPGSRASVPTQSSRAGNAAPVQDLLQDKLLLAAPRIDFRGRNVPALGSIPLLSRLGQGGMGAVYLGVHPRLDQDVAVKVLPFTLLDQQPQLVDRFMREARIAARVKSPHLVGVMDVNEENGLFFLVMEYVTGASAGALLRAAVKAGQPGIEETVALDICIAATQGLAIAHEEGIIHRDIKPDNILIPRARSGDQLLYPSAKLSDLGLARDDEAGQSLTGTQAALGTPGYMAPEQAMDAKKAGKPADVFSMGATLHAFLTGQSAFSGSSPMEIIFATIQKPALPVTNFRKDVSPDTMALIDRCLEKSPDKRYADGSILLHALRACREAVGDKDRTKKGSVVPVQLPPSIPDGAVQTPASKPVQSSTFVNPDPGPVVPPPLPSQMSAPRPRSNPWPAVAIAAAALIAIGLAVATYFIIKQPEKRQAQSPQGPTESSPPFAQPKQPEPLRPVERPKPVKPPDPLEPAKPDDQSPDHRTTTRSTNIAIQGGGDQQKMYQQMLKQIEAELAAQKAKENQTTDDPGPAIQLRQRNIDEQAEKELDVAEGYLDDGKYTEARVALERLKKKVTDPDTLETIEADLQAAKDGLAEDRFTKHMVEGRVALKNQLYTEAVEAFNAALSEKPDSDDARRQLALAKERLADKPVATVQRLNGNDRYTQAMNAAREAANRLPPTRLGVKVSDLNDELKKRYGLNAASGAVALAIVPGSPADKAGVKQGHCITRIGTVAITNAIDFQAAARTLPPGRVQIQVVSEHETLVMNADIGPRLTDQDFSRKWLDAETQYRRALSDRPNDLAATQELIQTLQLAGREALEANRAPEAFSFYSKAAQLNDPVAQYTVGWMYYRGTGTRQDFRNAAMWYKKSADQGYAWAQYDLGCLSREGQGVQQNDQEAVRLFALAANQNLPIAQNNLGMMYFAGRGVQANRNEAYRWVKKAADAGEPLAKQNLQTYFGGQ